MAVISLSTAWYLHLTKKDRCADDSCQCGESAKRKLSWLQSRAFLIAITAFALTAGAYPYLLGLYNSKQAVQITPPPDEVETLVLDSIYHADASYKSGTALVSYDPHLLHIDSIIHTVHQTGYIVKDYHRNNTSEKLH